MIPTLIGTQSGSPMLTEEEVYGGCNIVSNISGLGICVDKNAVNHVLIPESDRLEAAALLIVGDGGMLIRQCGACLLYIGGLSEKDVKIIMAEEGGQIVEMGCLSGSFHTGIGSRVVVGKCFWA